MKNDRRLIISVVLGAAAVFSLIYGITAPSKAICHAAPGREKAFEKKEAGEAVKVDLSLRRPRRSKYTSWQRSPFIEAKVSVTGLYKLTLNGIVWDEENPRAIINGQIVSVGDVMEGITIVEIKKDGVVLNDGVKNFEVKIE